jgi:DNA-binding PadR family transcriptional regulator
MHNRLFKESPMIELGREPESQLPLSSAVFHILLTLADGERHGYGIKQEVNARTEGRVRLGPGMLYGPIKRLLLKGPIEETSERPDADLDDERRRYYRLTDFGLWVLRAEVTRSAALVRQADAKQLQAHRSPGQPAGGQ